MNIRPLNLTGRKGDTSALNRWANELRVALQVQLKEAHVDAVALIKGFAQIFARPTPIVAPNQVGVGNTTATTATAGANGAVPAQVAGYLVINVGGKNFKVPYFNS